jgi:transposase-like protein
MDNKESIINEYLIGGISFRVLGKKYGISRSTINRWVLEHQGFICMRKSPKESISLLEMNKEPTGAGLHNAAYCNNVFLVL